MLFCLKTVKAWFAVPSGLSPPALFWGLIYTQAFIALTLPPLPSVQLHHPPTASPSPLPTALQGSHLPWGKSPRPLLNFQNCGFALSPPCSALIPLPTSLTLLQPRGLPHCPTNTPGPVLPQGLCTGCAINLASFSPRHSYVWFLLTPEVSAQTSLFFTTSLTFS